MRCIVCRMAIRQHSCARCECSARAPDGGIPPCDYPACCSSETSAQHEPGLDGFKRDTRTQTCLLAGMSYMYSLLPCSPLQKYIPIQIQTLSSSGGIPVASPSSSCSQCMLCVRACIDHGSCPCGQVSARGVQESHRLAQAVKALPAGVKHSIWGPRLRCIADPRLIVLQSARCSACTRQDGNMFINNPNLLCSSTCDQFLFCEAEDCKTSRAGKHTTLDAQVIVQQFTI